MQSEGSDAILPVARPPHLGTPPNLPLDMAVTKRPLLLTPGPVTIPEEVRQATARPLLYHRGPEFKHVVRRVRDGLKYLYQTREEVIVLASSGTGAMEGAVVNLCSRGDRVLVVRGGKFGERWEKIARAYGLDVVPLDVPWGEAVDPERVRRALAEQGPFRAVLLQASETSTGVAHPVREVADLTRRTDTLCVVDGITAVGVFPIPFDEWGIDCLVTGSQKALMLPPGLAFAGLSARAWQAAARADLPRFYFDFARERDCLAQDTTAWTPAISLIEGLDLVLERIREEGLDALFRRHRLAATAMRAGVRALGLSLFTGSPSDALTAIEIPDPPGASAVVKRFRDAHGMTIAGGQDQLKGRIIRLSHMGDVDRYHVVRALTALESVMDELGFRPADGAGVAAVVASYARGATE